MPSRKGVAVPSISRVWPRLWRCSSTVAVTDRCWVRNPASVAYGRVRTGVNGLTEAAMTPARHSRAGCGDPMSDPRPSLATMEWKIELIFIPVSDVDRAKRFYVDQLGFHADHDQQVDEQLRFVQCTPPGSACSIAFGTGI